MQATVICDLNYGDSSKGKMTDYFTTKDSVVIRYNGGANAGHTVVTPEGKRHVFSHFGAGTFRSASTYLSEHFIVNPLLWNKERQSLNLEQQTELLHDISAMVTLPHDMMLNQEVERKRNNNRHGSCGVGINETVHRCKNFARTSIDSVKDEETFKNHIKAIEKYYLPDRCEELELNHKEIINKIHKYETVERFFEATEHFLDSSVATTPFDCRIFNNIIFEGAQGLLLDEFHSNFPYVTRSRTGLDNVLKICRLMIITELNIIFVTRSYMTRHGAGPFPTEDKSLSFQDDTNQPNEFQGTLRFGHLDTEHVKTAIAGEMLKANKLNIKINPYLAMSHLDQYSDEDFVLKLAKDSGCIGCYVSDGPTRNNVKQIF